MTKLNEAEKIILGYRAGEQDALMGNPLNAKRVPRNQRTAYRNGFKDGERIRAANKAQADEYEALGSAIEKHPIVNPLMFTGKQIKFEVDMKKCKWRKK